MGGDEERKQFVTQVRKACRIGRKLREVGIRPSGVVRIDSAAGVSEWAKDPQGNTKKIAETFREACAVAEGPWRTARRRRRDLLGRHAQLEADGRTARGGDRPKTLGFQADMAHTLLYTLGYNAPEDRLLPDAFDWTSRETLSTRR